MGRNIKGKKPGGDQSIFPKADFLGFFLTVIWFKSPHVLISLINVSKLSHMGLRMVLEQAGVRTENWTLIPWVSGLFLPLSLH